MGDWLPGKDLDIGHANLLLERQREAPAAQTFGDPRAARYTSQAERLRYMPAVDTKRLPAAGAAARCFRSRSATAAEPLAPTFPAVSRRFDRHGQSATVPALPLGPWPAPHFQG